MRLNPTWLYLGSKGIRRTPSSRASKLGPTWYVFRLTSRNPLVSTSGSGLDWGWPLRDVGASLQPYQVGTHFEALQEGVVMAHSDFRHQSLIQPYPCLCSSVQFISWFLLVLNDHLNNMPFTHNTPMNINEEFLHWLLFQMLLLQMLPKDSNGWPQDIWDVSGDHEI